MSRVIGCGDGGLVCRDCVEARGWVEWLVGVEMSEMVDWGGEREEEDRVR